MTRAPLAPLRRSIAGGLLLAAAAWAVVDVAGGLLADGGYVFSLAWLHVLVVIGLAGVGAAQAAGLLLRPSGIAGGDEAVAAVAAGLAAAELPWSTAGLAGGPWYVWSGVLAALLAAAAAVAASGVSPARPSARPADAPAPRPGRVAPHAPRAHSAPFVRAAGAPRGPVVDDRPLRSDQVTLIRDRGLIDRGIAAPVAAAAVETSPAATAVAGQTAPAAPRAGWYPDPETPGWRWWDGDRWTDHRSGGTS